jgi:DNA-binding response OmpR family regulator
MPDTMPAAARLLYVEDELITQHCVVDTLREAGFAVTVASDGAEAINLLETATAPFRGLITDVDLGQGLDGWGIARRGRELVETLAVVYVSGASQHDWVSKGVPASVMIAKPCAPVQIVVAVSALLNAVDTKL